MTTSTGLGPPTITSYRDRDGTHPVLRWQLAVPMLALASAPLGGGLGLRSWIVNAQVALDYGRTDLAVHLGAIAAELGCDGAGIGFLTAAAVERVTAAHDDGVNAYATVGLRHPTWAARPAASVSDAAVGTINLVVALPVRLTEAALANAVMTATEAKTQALLEAGVPGTGTASDALCIVCPADGDAEQFAGPRARVGASLARAVHQAVATGIAHGWPATEEPGA